MKLMAQLDGREESVAVEAMPHGYRVTVGERVYAVDVGGVGPVRSLVIAGAQHEVSVRPLGDGRYRVAAGGEVAEVTLMDPLTHLARVASGGARSGPQRVTAYMPGVVKRVLVAEGDAVVPGQGLAVLEAMKMENEIEAETEGVVAKVLVEAGQAVDGGDPLFEIG